MNNHCKNVTSQYETHAATAAKLGVCGSSSSGSESGSYCGGGDGGITGRGGSHCSSAGLPSAGSVNSGGSGSGIVSGSGNSSESGGVRPNSGSVRGSSRNSQWVRSVKGKH